MIYPVSIITVTRQIVNMFIKYFSKKDLIFQQLNVKIDVNQIYMCLRQHGDNKFDIN